MVTGQLQQLQNIVTRGFSEESSAAAASLAKRPRIECPGKGGGKGK